MKYKHKKTRKEKIIADYRHQVYTLENKEIAPSVSPTTAAIKINNASYSYSFVLRDVLKTGLLTLSIIAAEITLFFLLKNHIIILPKISY